MGPAPHLGKARAKLSVIWVRPTLIITLNAVDGAAAGHGVVPTCEVLDQAHAPQQDAYTASRPVPPWSPRDANRWPRAQRCRSRHPSYARHRAHYSGRRCRPCSSRGRRSDVRRMRALLFLSVVPLGMLLYVFDLYGAAVLGR